MPSDLHFMFTIFASRYVLILSAYLLLVRILRFRRVNGLQRRFAPNGRKDFANLSNNDAHLILKNLTELEFPKFFGFSVIFALFKV